MFYKIQSLIEDQDYINSVGRMCWNEVDQMSSEFEFDPDWDLYELMELQGGLKYYCAYAEGGQRVGFAVVLMCPSFHSKGKEFAISDCIYVDPSMRGVGEEFLNFIVEDLQCDGVDLVSLHLKSTMRGANSLATRCGFTHYENVYQRRLN